MCLQSPTKCVCPGNIVTNLVGADACAGPIAYNASVTDAASAANNLCSIYTALQTEWMYVSACWSGALFLQGLQGSTPGRQCTASLYSCSHGIDEGGWMVRTADVTDHPT